MPRKSTKDQKTIFVSVTKSQHAAFIKHCAKLKMSQSAVISAWIDSLGKQPTQQYAIEDAVAIMTEKVPRITLNEPPPLRRHSLPPAILDAIEPKVSVRQSSEPIEEDEHYWRG